MHIDPTNQTGIGFDLYTVDPRHQAALIQILSTEQIPEWLAYSPFLAASIHRSLDGMRVFIYSQWQPQFDHRRLSPTVDLAEFFPPDSHLLQVFASRPASGPMTILSGGPIIHLDEFRMIPVHQSEMMNRTTQELDIALQTPGLLGCALHRSLDGTRIFNYAQWESPEAFAGLLRQPGFNPQSPYWAGVARHEYHLYEVAAVVNR